MKGKALIIYSSITGNTAKVAGWFQETFEHYNMEVTSIRVKNKMDWDIYECTSSTRQYSLPANCNGYPQTMYVHSYF